MKLVIVESPAKCNKIKKYLGDNYNCIASFGHLRGLDTSQSLSTLSKTLKPIFKILPEKNKQIKLLKDSSSICDEIILATDDDREGEAIAWHICFILNLNINKTKRIVFREITESAVQYAINHPRIINMNIVQAQISRQILDFAVGFTISPILWTNITRQSKNKLSAGRCQSPALRIIYEKYMEAKNSKYEIVHNINAKFISKLPLFKLNENLKSLENVEDFLKLSISFKHTLSIGNTKKSISSPPDPLITSTLQQKSSNILKYSPKQTMNIAQKLYEKGFITYMRTDSKVLSDDFKNSVYEYIEHHHGALYISSRDKKSNIKSNKKTQDAHEAIRPTDINRLDFTELDSKEKSLYKLIWKISVQSCMSPAEWDKKTLKILAPKEKYYLLDVTKLKFPGWLIIEPKTELHNFPNFELTNHLREGLINYITIESNPILIGNKLQISESKLVDELDQRGIGRPSTFASIVEKLLERNYVEKGNIKAKKISTFMFSLNDKNIVKSNIETELGEEKNKLLITPTGIFVIEFLKNHFEKFILDSYTSNMENQLDKIVSDYVDYKILCKQCFNELQSYSKNFQILENKVSIKIDKNHEYIIGKYGPVIKCTDSKKKISFKPVKKNIDIKDLENGKLKLDDILEVKISKYDIVLGEYKNEELILRKGKFGNYVTWGKNSCSLKNFTEEQTYESIVSYLNNNSNNLREINSSIKIKNGKFGAYIYKKTPSMKKPVFISLKDFPEDYLLCSETMITDYILLKGK